MKNILTTIKDFFILLGYYILFLIMCGWSFIFNQSKYNDLTKGNTSEAN